MSDTKDEWWVSRQGHQFGPVPFAQVVEAAREGRLEPRTDMLIGGDLTDWVPAGQVDGVFERVGGEEKPADKKSAETKSKAKTSTSEPLVDVGEFERKEAPTKIDLPGANRLGWFLGVTVLPVVIGAGLAYAMPQIQQMAGKDVSPWLVFLFLIPFLIVIVVTVKRFQNLAMNGAWTLGWLFVPFLNIWLQYRLFACPPGYAYTKKLDGIGKFLAVIYWLFFVAWLGLMGFAFTTGFKDGWDQAKASGQLQQLKNRIEEMRQAPAKEDSSPGQTSP